MSKRTYIVMNSDEAAAVAGPTEPGCALRPIMLADGKRFVLEPRAIDAPENADKRDLLLTYNQALVDDSEFVQVPVSAG